ncbi:type IV pilin protein [Candidatus Endomicrobiellum trichonymphae]|uniref:type IV pilin protein n=1 Tax=Endomicrobium trichonymphae TaxID=1408204 RepID=UPI0015520248|nr:prepilin-type N-terminal cleavage/methylation domain-containing protein [Candidatus Endomicrobium trichonymphae]
MKSEGFTLVEFVIVISIVGILSIIAVPIYRSYIEKTKTVQNISDVKESAVENISLKEVPVGVSSENVTADKSGDKDVRVA